MTSSSSGEAVGSDDARSGFVSLERHDHVAIVTLQRPSSLNAISGRVADELARAFRSVAADGSVWVMILQASGDKAFCVGADLKERAAFSLADFHRNRVQMRRMFAALRSVPQPTIAAIFGHTLGGGFELALSCDVVVAAEDVRVGLPEARVGLLPAGGGTQLLARAVGPSKAKELIFTGERLGAREASLLGLVSRVVPRAELESAARTVALEICSSSPVALRAAKRSIDAGAGVTLDEGLEIEQAAWSVVVASRDRAEGIASFNDKREARWSNS